MTQPQDNMRAEFELWAKSEGIPVMHDEDGYISELAQAASSAWQAACAQQSAQSQQDALDAVRYRWLAAQHWVEPEATARMSLPDTVFINEYMEHLGEAIDASIGKFTAIATQGASNV